MLDGRTHKQRRRGVELDEATVMTITAYAESLARREVKPASIGVIVNRLRLLADELHPRPLLEASHEDLTAFLNRRVLAPRSRAWYLSLLHGFYEWCVIGGLVGADPTLWVRRPDNAAPRPAVRMKARTAQMVTNPARPADGRARAKRLQGLELDEMSVALIGEYLHVMERRGCRPASVATIGRKLRLLAEHLRPRSLGEAEAEDIERFLDRRRLTARSRYAYVSHLHGFFKWAAAWGRVPGDPTLRVVRPRFPRSLPRPIEDEDLREAFRAATPQVAAILALAAFHGLRAGEIAGLQREDILDRHTPPVILVLDGKGGHQRVLPLHDEAWSLIEPWALGRRGWLFTMPNGAPMRPHNVSHLANAFLHEWVGTASSIHSLRHWFGTKVYAASRDLRLTQALMGHASPNTTVGYVAWSAEDGRAAVSKIGL